MSGESSPRSREVVVLDVRPAELNADKVPPAERSLSGVGPSSSSGKLSSATNLLSEKDVEAIAEAMFKKIESKLPKGDDEGATHTHTYMQRHAQLLQVSKPSGRYTGKGSYRWPSGRYMAKASYRLPSGRYTVKCSY